MISLPDKDTCCGCSACVSICSQDCITMEYSKEGFLYPKISYEKCIGCERCVGVCPVVKSEIGKTLTEAYIVQNKDESVRKYSSSGGAFLAIAEYIIKEKHGVVYGAGYDDDFRVYHYGVSTIDEAKKFCGSKYVQSDISDCYEEIKKYLSDGRYVCFSGTPCQISALKNYLRKAYEKLVTIDIACHGVPSPELFRKYLDYWETKIGCSLEQVEFRNKKYGYSGSTMCLTFRNGTVISHDFLLQFYKNAMFAGLSLRPSCHNCRFKTKERISDFTIFDCWDTNIYEASMDDDKGTTSVLIHSNVGRNIFEEIRSNFRYQRVDSEKLIFSNGDMMTECAGKNPKRENFFDDYQNMSIEELNKKYFPVTIKKRMVFYLKPIFSKWGILNKIKRYLKK